MALNGSTSRYLQQSSAVGTTATPGHLDCMWFKPNTSLGLHTLVCTAELNSIDNHSRQLVLASSGPPYAFVRSRDTGSANAEVTALPAVDSWNSLIGAWCQTNLREGYLNGANRVQSTAAKTLNAPAFTRISGNTSSTVASNTVHWAEFSRWDISTFKTSSAGDLAIRAELAALLGTAIDGTLPNPLTINDNSLSGTYTQTGTAVTLTVVAHGWVTGMTVTVTYSTGAGVAGSFVVTVSDANTLTYTATGSQTASGACTITRPWTGKLIGYWTFENRSAASRSNKIGATAYEFAEVGAWNDTFIFAHPSVAPYAEPSITSSDPAIWEDGAPVDLVGERFLPLTADPDIEWGGVGQTVTAATNTTATITAAIGLALYGVERSVVVRNEYGAESDGTFVAEMVPPNYNHATPSTRERYANISTAEYPLAATGVRLTSTPDLVDGAQVHFKSLANASAEAQDIDLLTINEDGSISIVSTVTLPATFQARVNLNDGEGWSAFATQTLTEAEVTTPVLTGEDQVFYVTGLNTLVSASIAGLVSTGTWLWEVDSGSFPPGVTIDDATGLINGRPGELGTFAAVITATGAGGSVEITVNFGIVTAGTIINQSLRQIGFRAIGSTAGAINGDMLAAMVSDLGDDSGTINEIMTKWLQYKLTSSTDSLPALMAEAAADRGVSRWQEITDVAAIGT